MLCNPAVKLRLLCEYADALGAKYIATGHYARAEGGALYMGRPENDQSYMLCRILPEQLSRLILPLGGMIKTETRALAASLGLPVAQKPDSMELCFVPGGDYAEIRPATGEVVLADGDGLYSTEFTASDMRWLVPEPLSPFDCEVRVRHSRTLTSARAWPEGGGRLRIVPASPLRAPTPGQTAAIYSAGRVLGGGFIERDTKDTI